jgi:two-component system NtrC family sensor kinase
VADDEPGIRAVLSDVLNQAGYQVTTVATGKEALKRVTDTKFDLVFCDLCMPGLDGEELWRILRKEQPALAKRIIFVTGDTVSPQSRTFLEQTGNRWLSKPFNIADVEQIARTMLCPDPLRALTDTPVTGAVRRYHPAGA